MNRREMLKARLNYARWAIRSDIRVAWRIATRQCPQCPSRTWSLDRQRHKMDCTARYGYWLWNPLGGALAWPAKRKVR